MMAILCLSLSHSLSAQNYFYNTYEITTANGLLSNRVSSIYQDEDGFIWLQTLEGVGRYDGHDFKWFTKSTSNLRGVPRGHSIVEDADGYFWLTDGVHVDLMKRKTFEVMPLSQKFGGGTPIAHGILRFWQGNNGGIYLKQRKTEAVFYYHPDSGVEAVPKFDGASQIMPKKDGIWVCYPNGECRKYDAKNGRVLKSFAEMAGPTLIAKFREEEDWFSYFDGNKQEVVILQILPEGKQEVMRISCATDRPSQRFLLVYNPVEDQLIMNAPHEDHSFSIVDVDQKKVIPAREVIDRGNKAFLYTHFVDNRGVYWQQSARGLRLLKVSTSSFERYLNGEQSRGLWANASHVFIQNKYVSFAEPEKLQRIPEPKRIKTVWAANKNELWVGGSDGIFELDTTNFSIKQKVASLEVQEGLWSLIRDREDQWWAGGLFTGLYLKTRTDSLLRPYKKLNGFDRFAESSIIHLLEDGPYLWASTNTGLYLVHKDKGVVQYFSSTVSGPHHLPLYDIHFLHKDAAGVYWVATNADGLIRFELNDDLSINQFQKYTTDDNLSSNTLYAILEDKQERLWISTLNGLSCFDKKTGNIQLFLMEDGLAESEFNRISYYQDNNGKMYFGTIKGVVSFQPEEIKVSTTYDANVYLSTLEVYDGKQKRIVSYEPLEAGEVVLQPDNRFLRLGVTVLDYFQPERLSYTYQIEGLIEEYQPIKDNVLELGGLPYGRHLLQIRGQSRDRLYAQEELVLWINVLRPVYYRWWFVLLMLGILTLGAFLLYYFRLRQLRRRERELETLVSERTQQIEEDNAIISKQAEKLKEMDQIKSRFFTNISHELRTPLTLILAPLEGVLRQSSKGHPFYERLQLMQQNGQRLLKRINELLDLSLLDAKQLDADETPTLVCQFLRNNLTAFTSMANLKSLNLVLECSLREQLTLFLDQDKLEKILSNYLSNAIKYTPEGGRIILQAEHVGDQLQLSVSDTGIGISAGDLDRIFDRFYQVSRSSQKNGSGIGLALCQELARTLNGKVWATSEVGKGSIFYLQLPFREADQNSGGRLEEASEQSPLRTELLVGANDLDNDTRPQVLVVEDNSDLRKYLQLLLQDQYRVVTFEHGRAAIDHLAIDERPSLIVSDIMMPMMDGFELLTAVKGSDEWRGIPMLMLTARQDQELKSKALRIGVDDYLTKPFKEEELLVRVAHLVRHRGNGGAEDSASKPVSAADLRWLEELEGILVKHLSSPDFKLVEAASAMNISYRRLQQRLKALTGLTPKRYQRSIKLAKARELLKSGQYETVTEVMYQLGFDNQHYFSKLYKEEFGIGPRDELS